MAKVSIRRRTGGRRVLRFGQHAALYFGGCASDTQPMRSSSARLRYQGLDRRAAPPGAESVDVKLASTVLAAALAGALGITHFVDRSALKYIERASVGAGCLAILAGVALFMQWRIDGRARTW